MKKGVQLNYEELHTIVRRLRDEGEMINSLHQKTREKVHDLYLEWIGEGAEKFFEEMETRLLPALSRLAQALFASQIALTRIMKTIKDADQHTALFFKKDLEHFGVTGHGITGTDISDLLSKARPRVNFGAGIGGIGSGLTGRVEGLANEGVVDTARSTDLIEHGSGIGDSQQGFGSTGDTRPSPTGGAGNNAEDLRGGGTGNAGSSGGNAQGSNSGSGGTGTGPVSAIGNQAGTSGIPDHVYGNSRETGVGTGVGNSHQTGIGNEVQAQTGDVRAAAAGVAGVAGAAGTAAGAVKAVRGRRK